MTDTYRKTVANGVSNMLFFSTVVYSPDDERLLPEGWVDYARTRTSSKDDPAAPYGAHWWLGVGGPGSFSANGYDGQYTVVVPDLDLVLVRHGATPLDLKDNLKAWVGEVIGAIRQGA